MTTPTKSNLVKHLHMYEALSSFFSQKLYVSISIHCLFHIPTYDKEYIEIINVCIDRNTYLKFTNILIKSYIFQKEKQFNYRKI